jgi:hypothetical protein
VQQDDEQLTQVGWAMAWLFSCSGNTLIDFDDESLAEIPPLTWDQDDLAFAIELIEETSGMLSDVNAGLKLLEEQPHLLEALADHVKHLYRILAKQKGNKNEPRVRLEWPSVIAGSDGSAVAHPELLQLRGDAA